MFEVGKKVVCIKNHSQAIINGLKRGKVYELLGIRRKSCGCPQVQLNIGLICHKPVQCFYCQGLDRHDGIWWLDTALFAPLTDETIGDKTIGELMGNTVTVDNERYFQLEQQNINHSAH